MKQVKAFIWMLFIIPAFILSSCEKLFEAEQEGLLELGILIDEQDGLKSVLNDTTTSAAQYVIVTVVNENGVIVMNDEQIELFNFGGHWVTKNIKLKTGAYELTKFLVVDALGNVLYAAPIEGSPKAYLVNDPLPIQFVILTNQVTRVNPEVLPVGHEPPEEFGYVSFTYHIVKPLDFFIGVYIKEPFIMPPFELTDAKLTVKVDSLWWHSFELEAKVNKVTIRDGYRCYLLIIEKEGYNPVRVKVSHEDLVNTSENNPLLVGIPADSLYVVVLQPGPDKGKDAMINRFIPDKNFGKITTTYSVGDGIKGLTGTLTEYAKLLEFVPYSDPGTASSTGNTLTPQVVTITEFNTNQESYESELVKIVGVKFTDANGTAVFQEKKNYSISVGTDATILRTIFLGTDLTGKIIPYMADVTGIATVYNTDAQLTPRNYADLVIYSSDATLSDLKVSGTTVTGFAAGTLTYNVSLPAGTTAVPAVTATATEANATVVITPATSLTGDAAARTTKIDVTSQDKASVKNYTIVFTVATGIDDYLSDKLRIYPVPAHNEITAEGIEGITMIEIYEVTGKKVSSIRCAEDSFREIPVADLSRGLYFIKFIGPDGVILKKFIKE